MKKKYKKKQQPVKKQVAFTYEHMQTHPKRYQTYRKEFYQCYKNTQQNQNVNFYGTVRKLDFKKGVLLTDVTVMYHDTNGDYHEGTENHVWIRTIKPFLYTGITVDQSIEFSGKLRPYYKYGQLDLAIWNVHDIHHIQDIS